MSAKVNLQGIAAAWYRREDWPRWLEIDRTMHPDFDAMQTRLDSRIRQLQAGGIPVIRVTLDVDEFLVWSKKNGGKTDTMARAQYACERSMRAEAAGVRR